MKALKSFGFLAVMIGIVMVSAACGKKAGNTPASPGGNSLLNMSGKYPITREPYEMEILLPTNANVIDFATNEQTVYMEKLTNVKINFTTVPANDLSQKLNILLNAGGGRLPDVFWGCASFFTLDKMQSFGENGLIRPLNDILDNYAPNFNQINTKYADKQFRQRLTSLDGNIYGLATIQADLQIINALPYRMWINQTFLDKLGLPMPSDSDSFYAYLKAVKERDPNGNGKRDEIPLTGSLSTPASPYGGVDVFIMNMFILNDYSNHRLILNNGVVSPAYTTPEWKEGLAFMNKLFNEGLLDPNAFTQNEQQLRQIVEMEDAMRVGAASSFADRQIAAMGGGRINSYKILPPLKGPRGIQTTPYLKYSDLTNGMAFVVSRDCKQPEVALRWGDAFLDENPEIGFYIRYGLLGRDWEIPQTGTGISITGQTPRYREINTLWGMPQNVHWASVGLRFMAFNAYERTPLPGYDSEAILYDASMKYKPYLQDPVPPLLFTTAESGRLRELQSTLDTFVNESIARFVTGDLNLDRGWGPYLAELDVIGLKEYSGIMQNAYNRQWKK